MPVEIKELVVRAVVRQGGAEQERLVSGKDSGNRLGGEERDHLLADCVQEVLEILARSKER